MSDATRSSRPLLLALATLAAVLWAPITSYRLEGPRGMIHYLAGDAFYYLVVAAASVDTPFYTFDGIHPTNGFHPAWQILLTAIFDHVRVGEAAQMGIAVALSAACVAIGAAFFAVALLRVCGHPLLALLATVPGFYWLVIGRPHPEMLTPWSYVNGMESPLSILFFGVLCWLVLARDALGRGSRAGLLAVSAALAGVLLSRLDDVFLVALVVLWGGWRAAERRVARAAWLALVPTLSLGAYLVYSQLVVGTWLPVSAAAKASGLVDGLLRNVYAIVTMLLPIVDVRHYGIALWERETVRVLQMLAPAAVALAYLFWARPFRGGAPADPSGRQRELGGVLAIYVLVKTGYNFVWVGLYHQGHWYYPLAMLSIGLHAVLAVGPLLDRSPLLRTRAARAVAPVGCALLLLFSAASFAARKANARPLAGVLSVWDARERIQRELDARCAGCGIVAFDDGTLAFVLRNPVINGLGFAGDVELARALREGRLLPLAWERGHRLLGTASYPFGIAAGDDPAALREKLARYGNLEGQALDGWRFELLWIDEGLGASFVRFAPEAPR